MKRLMTYLFIAFLAIGCCQSAYASTDLVSNALTQSNSFLKDAGLVQKKYSGIARKYVTMKTGNLENLGGEIAKKNLLKADSLKMKAEKLQTWMNTAQEKKAELENKYNALNAQALEYKEKADKALAEGKAINEQYKTMKSSAEDMINDAKSMKNMVEGIKDQALGEIKDMAAMAKDTASDVIGFDKTAEIETKETKDSVAGNEQAVAIQSEEKLFRQPIQRQTAAVSQAAMVQPQAAVPQAATIKQAAPTSVSYNIQQSNKADAIRSAAIMANQPILEPDNQLVPLQMPDMPVVAKAVSATDVMAAAESMPTKRVEAEQLSPLNLEEQLMKSSNNAINIKQPQTAQLKAISDNKTAKPQKRSVLRKLFDRVTGQDEEPNTIANDSLKAKAVPQYQLEDNVIKSQIKEKINDKAL